MSAKNARCSFQINSQGNVRSEIVDLAPDGPSITPSVGWSWRGFFSETSLKLANGPLTLISVQTIDSTEQC